ncbi:hypothetical protein [Neobacillus niacini]|uniref:hypothetical protein n=1 Tax=Neobacillus niacini TaxID=86668 RepID=UPI001C8DCC9C|nr:hypothetical protein [Neobacillus niacini]MBY0146717.1 hypothetical protein [Neobacillus niacini]
MLIDIVTVGHGHAGIRAQSLLPKIQDSQDFVHNLIFIVTQNLGHQGFGSQSHPHCYPKSRLSGIWVTITTLLLPEI